MLRAILEDAVAVLDAQRGAIVLCEPPDNKLKLKAITSGRTAPSATLAGRDGTGRFQFSNSLANRCVSRGESILCLSATDDSELSIAQSVMDGAMSSLLCVLLRTPRKKLGILHLDRNPYQKPFTDEDLRLADALAASVSAGIECAQLLQKERDLRQDTILLLAQAVELRDPYTGGHTERVKNYSILLGQQMKLSARDMELIRTGTPLHDIGKIGIDDAILRKPDKLTPAEFETIPVLAGKRPDIVLACPGAVSVIAWS